MQISIGRDWVIEFSVSVYRACSRSKLFRTTPIGRTPRPNALAGPHLQWERDKLAGQMLSDWNRHVRSG